MPRARTSERRQTIGTVNVDTRVWTKEVRAKTHHTWNPAHRGWGMSKDAWGEYSPLVDTLVLHDFDYKETWQVSVEKFNTRTTLNNGFCTTVFGNAIKWSTTTILNMNLKRRRNKL